MFEYINTSLSGAGIDTRFLETEAYITEGRWRFKEHKIINKINSLSKHLFGLRKRKELRMSSVDRALA